MTRPIRPDELAEATAQALPDYVIKAINKLLTRKLRFKQTEAVLAILDEGPEELTIADVYDRAYLAFEPAYRAAGWTVVYDKPGYCESYPATFAFSRGKS